jgi:hypothetical protein
MIDLALSDAEATLLAGMAGADRFPAALPPEMDDEGWAAVARGLLARGLAHGEGRLEMSDAVAGLIRGAVLAERSLWIEIQYQPGAGDNWSEVLWLGGEGVVRHRLDPDAHVHHLERCARSAVDELLAATFDFPTALDSEAGVPQRISQFDFAYALDLNVAEGPGAVADRYPAAGDYAAVLTDARRATRVKLDGRPGDETFPWREIEIVEAPQGLWLMHDVLPGPPADDGSGIVVIQRITVDMAREQLTALAEST